MNYMTQFQNELANKLSLQEHPRTIVEWVCGKMLESYKNGLAAGRKRAAVNRQGKNRSNGSPAQAQ